MYDPETSVLLDGLATYAIERQAGWERHQPDGLACQPEKRNQWIRDILQGLAGPGEGGASQSVREFDRRLEQARGCFAVEPAPLFLQRDTVRCLCSRVYDLSRMNGDQRRRVMDIRELMEDMAAHLPWDSRAIRLDEARDNAQRTLLRMAAQRPIRFTRILLGGEWGPGDSGFVSGAVIDAEAVKGTQLYQSVRAQYPEVTNWPAVCTVYAGGGGRYLVPVLDADELDLEIIDMAGDRFLDMPGVSWAGGPYEMRIAEGPAMTMM